MKFNNIFLSAALAALVLSGCGDKIDPSEIDSATRIALSKDIPVFAADGLTEEGEDTYRAIVTIVQGDKINGVTWDFSVDDPKKCAEVNVADISEEFKGTFEGDSRTVTGKGLEVRVKANPEYKRTFTLTIKAADGTEQPFVFTQLGDKADAEVSSETQDIEFLAEGGETMIAYTTNMGEEYSFSASYEGDSKDWLSWDAAEPGKVRLTASKWTDKTNARNAVFRITVGSSETSLASLDIPVIQIAADDYYFMYGASTGLTIEKSLQMNKVEKGVYSAKAYFVKSSDGHNAIIFNRDSRTLAYPCYALGGNGEVIPVESSSSALPAGPEIDIDGLRSLSVNFNDLTWKWERVTTPNCMPDSEVSKYKTKAFIARDGSMKVWMVENMRWNGGGITPKLGSPMVPVPYNKATGGYPAESFPSSWDDPKLNMAYECTEIGGQLEGTDEYGRIYAFSEILTGIPTNGIGFARREKLPVGWTDGCEITDAVGDKYVIEYINHTKAGTFSGDNSADEQTHPTLKMQIQGICPYGWHIANTSDWLDIAYAACKASAGHTYPIREDQVTYKHLSNVNGKTTGLPPRGIENLAPWLRNKKHWASKVISDGADDFGFESFPLGLRYMTQGYQGYKNHIQQWIPLFFSDTAPFRLMMLWDNNTTCAEITNIDNGQAIQSFRCVKNYKQ